MAETVRGLRGSDRWHSGGSRQVPVKMFAALAVPLSIGGAWPALLSLQPLAVSLYIGGAWPAQLQPLAAALYVSGAWLALLRPWRCPLKFRRCVARVDAALAVSLYAGGALPAWLQPWLPRCRCM